MRIALLSTLDRDPKPGVARPAFASFAGAMLVERQLDLAIRLGCERVACIVDAVEREVVELQHRAESAGIKFRAIRHPNRLSGMVTADDELLVISPGVLPDDDAAAKALDKRAVLAFPADVAVPLGYERIDLELAWSGVMIVPGLLVERLGNLPADVDVPSALLRLALQTGTPLVQLNRELAGGTRWQLNPDRAALDRREKEWIDAQREAIPFLAPGRAIAERAGARLARDVVGQAAEPVPAAAAIAAVLGAAGSAALGYPAIGLALVAFAALFGHMAGVVDRVAKLGRPKRRMGWIPRFLDYAVDPLLVLLLVLAAPEDLGYLRAFVPLTLIGLLRLGETHASRKWRASYGDRITLGFALAMAAFVGFSSEVAAVIALIVLATRFFSPFRAD